MLQETNAPCPYCGEVIDLLLDVSVSEQDYIEDCSVCCRPLSIRLCVDGQGGYRVEVRREDDV